MPALTRTAGFSFTSTPIYVAFTGNRIPFNVDTIKAIESLWMDIKTPEGEGSVAPRVRDVSYSSPLTYTQEKAGDVREAVARIEIPQGYESQYFAAIRREVSGFTVTLLPEFRKAETRKVQEGVGLRSATLAKGYDKLAATTTLTSLIKAASVAGRNARQHWGAGGVSRAFTSFIACGDGSRIEFMRSLGDPYMAQVKSAFVAAFEEAPPKVGSRKVADFTMQDIITKMLKDFGVMQQAIGSMHSQVHSSESDRNHDLTAQVDPLHKKATDFLAALEKFDTFLKTPVKTSGLKVAGMGRAEYVRRLRSLKSTLGHLMADASVGGTAPRNLRKADAALDAEVIEARGIVKEEPIEEAPITPTPVKK